MNLKEESKSLIWQAAIFVITVLLAAILDEIKFTHIVKNVAAVQSGELPEDCDQRSQYYHLAESRCHNCSDVMRLFEPGYQEWQASASATTSDSELVSVPATSATNSNNNENNNNGPKSPAVPDARTIVGPRLTPLPGPNGNGGVLATANPSKNLSSNARQQFAQVRQQPPARTRQANAILSRLVLADVPRSESDSPEGGSQPELELLDERPPELADGAPQEASSALVDDANYGSLAQQLASERAESRHESGSTGVLASLRLARQWQRLLMGFLRSRELSQLGLLEAVARCRQDASSAACQLWSNVCVLTMYAHADTLAPGGAAPNTKSRLTGGGGGGGGGARGLPFASSWQECPKFSLLSICNSLREWHRSEKPALVAAGASGEVQDIFWASSQAPEELVPEVGGVGLLGRGPGAVPLVPFKPDQLIQLLAYSYALDGRLVRVSQFDLRDLGRFCLFSPSARSRSSNDNHKGDQRADSASEQPSERGNLEHASSHLDEIRVGKSASLSCRFDALQASVFAPQHVNETIFVDLFVGYQQGGATFIRPVPILIRSLLTFVGGASTPTSAPLLPNVKYARDPSRWKLVHRYFTLASLSLEATAATTTTSGDNKTSNYRDDRDASDQDGGAPELRALVFARDANLEIKFKRQARGVVINSMLLHLEYDFSLVRPPSGAGIAKEQQTLVAAAAAAAGQQRIRLTQSLVDMPSQLKDLDLVLTILCLASAIWSLIKCYNVQRYQGFVKLDLYSLLLFLVIACDIVANLLALVTALFALYLYCSVKFSKLFQQQQLFQMPLMLPADEATELDLLTKLKLAFALKLVGLLYKLYVRLSADLFLIDWERPKMLTSSQLMSHRHAAQQQAAKPQVGALEATGRQQQPQQQQVSFWRPYAIANRWLALQTTRRLNLTLQLIALICCLDLLELDKLTGADANLTGGDRPPPLNPLEPRLETNESALFRSLLLAALYLCLASAQIAYKRFFHEPMLRSAIREFVDLCSVANVSLFAMLYPRYGFYLHGRSANGSGDCGIAEMNVLLEREERELCSKRGLLPNSDHQTFTMLLPKIINEHYRKLLLLFRHDQQIFGPISGSVPEKAGGGKVAGSQQAATFMRSALSLPGGQLSSSSSSSSSTRALGSIESVVARNKAINQFLINFIDHTYADIDYTIRERRRFESLLMEIDPSAESDGDEATRSLSPLSGQKQQQVPPVSNLGGVMSMLMRGASSAGDLSPQASPGSQKAATLFVDYKDSFASLLLMGLEWDLLLVELFVLLHLDLLLGKENLALTIGALWLMNKLFQSAYSLMARKNLVTKSMLDDKFLIRA